MALTDESNGNGFYMPVAPAYGYGGGNNGNNGFGGDWAWLIILLLAFNGGWGNGFGGGFGGGMLGYDFPWLLNGQQNIMANDNGNYRDAMLNDGITSVRDGINGLSTQLCNCCGDMQMALAGGFANAETAANARQMANMQQGFGIQTAITGGINNLSSQLAQCCCDNRLASEQLRYTIATENCADREALNYSTRDIIAAFTSGIQSIKDEICADRLESYKRENDNLRTQLNMAALDKSQTAQTAELRQSGASQLNQLVSELRNCPIPAQPVYGNQPIFQCSGPAWNNNCGCNSGCGCGNF